jgi:hypothetical protein
MRLPWSKKKSATPAYLGSVSKSEAALSGSDGDGKVHDLEYWLASGFLTLPRPDPNWPAADASGP